jgi:plasmid stabilization system protein ParE
MNRLVVSEDARLDAIEAALWYESQRLGLGLDFELCLEAGLHQIQRHPLHCEERYKNIRIHFLERFPYGIHYLSEHETIRVFGIFHTSRNPSDWFERLK